MSFKEIFINNKDSLLFCNDSEIVKLRENILKKFNDKYFNKKSNESIKNIDLNSIDSLIYNFSNSKILSSIKVSKRNIYDLSIVNGFCEDFIDNNLFINVLNEKKSNNIFYSDLFPKNDYIIDLNSLLTNSGYELTVKKNQKALININNKFSKESFTVFQKNIINCEEGSEVIIIDKYNNDLSSFHNIVTMINLKNNSKLKHIIIQKNLKYNDLYLTTQTDCFKNAEYKQTVFNFSDSFVRNHHYSNLLENGSAVNHDGVFFLKNTNKNENKTYVRHKSNNCKSDQIYKGVLSGKSKASYFSNTFVEKSAQKTEGYQLSKGIILSDEATFFSKPELRIYADDVKCSHGSTIGPIDEQQIYYIRSRGINKIDATKILVKSFITDNLEKVNNQAAQFEIEGFIDNYLDQIN